ncbi:DNA primase [Mechercharimyces sp. CAU 1602]|nr:DNA primase [Mechercharimyces sp. CAU 1602]
MTSGQIPDSVISRVREQHDILDVVSQHVQLKKSGRNYFGLCPFHSEKTPSFSVAPDKQIFYCFGCGQGGDVIKFIMEIEQFTFYEAISHMASEAGIALPERKEKADDPQEAYRGELRRAMDLSSRFYHHILQKMELGLEARKYLIDRGVTEKTIETFQLGYAPPSYNALLRFLTKREFTPALLADAGLVSRKEHSSHYYDRFRGRIIFPIHDGQGNVIAFGGRALDEGKPKYLNSPETPLFHKGRHLFNLHRARKSIRQSKQAILFEGYMDVIAAWQVGIDNGVASLGTSLTADQAKVIRRNGEQVIVCYDSDEAGQQAADRGLETLREQDLHAKVAQMPAGLDPDDYIKLRGVDAFRQEVLAAAIPLTAFKLEELKKGFNVRDEGERMKYLTEALSVVAELPLAIEQDHYVRRLGEEFHLSLDALKAELRRIRNSKKRMAQGDKGKVMWNNEYHPVNKHMVGSHRLPSAHEQAEKLLLAWMLRDKEVALRVEEELGADFCEDVNAAIAAYLYAFYDDGYQASPVQFIHYVNEDYLMKTISELAMMELPEDRSDEAISDYIRHVQMVPLYTEMKKLEEEQKQAEQAGDIAKATQLGIQLVQLREKSKRRA